MPDLPPAPIQYFETLRPELYRFRYEKIAALDLPDLSEPSWILYYAFSDGCILRHEGKEFECARDCFHVLSPRTAYGIWMRRPLIQAPGSGVFIRMSPITEWDDVEALRREGYVLHFFAHYSLGSAADRARKALVKVPLDATLKALLDESARMLTTVPDQESFGRAQTALLESLLLAVTSRLPSDLWDLTPLDPRMETALRWIKEHLAEGLSTPEIARRHGMSETTCSRLFREQMGKPPQAVVREHRIEKACLLLTHTRLSIDEIAERCGFCDRFYFSRVFRQETRQSPAAYRHRFESGGC